MAPLISRMLLNDFVVRFSLREKNFQKFLFNGMFGRLFFTELLNVLFANF